jgi:hypothetical protein
MMMYSYNFVAIFISVCTIYKYDTVDAFHNPSLVDLRSVRRITNLSAIMSPEEERAAALSDYLAKAHEEKLRAINEVEKKKNSEINQLKQQIAELSSSSSSSSAVVMVNGEANVVKALEEMNKEELVAKIVQYQNFMRQYMIDAQEQKYRAVQEAQIAAQKKLSESLTLLGISPALSSSTSDITSSTATSPLYTARNAAVTKAAAAGQSRWGEKEVQRITNTQQHQNHIINGASTSSSMSVNGGSVPVMNTATPATTAVASPVVVPVPPEVAEADHGLRSDGSIGGLTLAERIYFGSNAAPAVATASSSSSSSSLSINSNPMETLYNKRNIKVVQAAKSGVTNRWGPQEIERVTNIVTTTNNILQQQHQHQPIQSSTPTSQRVNFGASILGQP